MPGQNEKKKNSSIVTLGKKTSLDGIIKFNETLRVQGKFKGKIDASGSLIVDKEAEVKADMININSIIVYGSVIGNINAIDKIDLKSGAKVQGDLSSARLRIADGVLFEGKCNMTGSDKEIEIFSRPTEEIKAELLRQDTSRV